MRNIKKSFSCMAPKKTAELYHGNEMMKATLGDLLVVVAAQESLIFINATTRES